MWRLSPALGIGLYLASSDRYENQILPSGFPSGSPEENLDRAGRWLLAFARENLAPYKRICRPEFAGLPPATPVSGLMA